MQVVDRQAVPQHVGARHSGTGPAQARFAAGTALRTLARFDGGARSRSTSVARLSLVRVGTCWAALTVSVTPPLGTDCPMLAGAGWYDVVGAASVVGERLERLVSSAYC